MDKQTISKLTKRIDVHMRPGRGGGKPFPYIKGKDVITRLNEAFMWEWSSEVKQTITTDSYIVVLVAVKAGGVEHQAFGGASIHKFTSGENAGQPIDVQNAYKSAFTNALKKAAEQFGIGLETSDGFDLDSLHEPAAPSASTARSTIAPATLPKEPKNEPVTGHTTVKTVSDRDIEGTYTGNDLDKFEDMLRAMLPSKSSSINKDFMDNLSDSDLDLLKQYSKMAKHIGNNVQEKTKPEMPFDTSNVVDSNNKVTFVREENDDDLKINDLQLGALQALAKARAVEEKDAIAKALSSSTKTAFDDLTRGEARQIIRLLNNIG